MTDKEIIIGGVDISKCEYLNTFSDCDGYHDYCELADNIENQYCKHYANCYYKQLQRKTTECNKYEQALIEVYKIIVALLTTKDVKYLSKEINGIIDIITKAKDGNE